MYGTLMQAVAFRSNIRHYGIAINQRKRAMRGGYKRKGGKR